MEVNEIILPLQKLFAKMAGTTEPIINVKNENKDTVLFKNIIKDATTALIKIFSPICFAPLNLFSDKNSISENKINSSQNVTEDSMHQLIIQNYPSPKIHKILLDSGV